MTGLELMRAVYRFEPTARVPIRPHGYWPETIERWKGEGLPEDWQASNFFEVESTFGTGVHLGTAYWSPFFPRNPRKSISRDDTYELYEDENYRLMRRRNDCIDQSVAEYLRFPVDRPEAWSRFRAMMDPLHPDRVAALDEQAERYARIEPGTVPVQQTMCGPFRMLWHAFGDTHLAYALYDHPGLVHEILESWVEMAIHATAHIAMRMPIHLVAMLEDAAYKNGSMISPEMFRSFLAPYYRQFVDHMKKNTDCFGVFVDSDGDVHELIPILLDNGVDCIGPMEVNAGMDVVALRRTYSRRLVIWGGIDKLEIAKGRTAIDRELDRVLPPLLDQGGYIVSLDHGAHPDISLEDYLYFLERARAYSG